MCVHPQFKDYSCTRLGKKKQNKTKLIAASLGKNVGHAANQVQKLVFTGKGYSCYRRLKWIAPKLKWNKNGRH